MGTSHSWHEECNAGPSTMTVQSHVHWKERELPFSRWLRGKGPHRQYCIHSMELQKITITICSLLEATFKIGISFNYTLSTRRSLTHSIQVWLHFTIFTHSNKLTMYIVHTTLLGLHNWLRCKHIRCQFGSYWQLLIFLSFPCRHQCEYGPPNDFANVIVIYDWLIMQKGKLEKERKRKCIPNGKGHKGHRASKKNEGIKPQEMTSICFFCWNGCSCC